MLAKPQRIKILINEAKKPKNFELLFEMSVKDVLGTVGSKATRKIIYQYKMLEAQERNIKDPKISEEIVNYLVNDLIKAIANNVPRDVTENDAGLAAGWLKKFFLSSYDIYKKYLIANNQSGQRLPGFLENYFKVRRFVQPEERDLMNIADTVDLKLAIDTAMPKYKAYIEKKDYADAAKGTEIIYEDDKYTIFIPHNKGAACELGKRTSWCTAAPGLDYYANYHKPNDPLFIIWAKPTKPGERQAIADNGFDNAIEKYQFHYGTSQFMNSEDEQIYRHPGGVEIIKEVHRILLQTVGDKFPFLADAFIETDIGLSVKEINDDHGYYKIKYVDLARGTDYGGNLPEIIVEQYEEPEKSIKAKFQWAEVKEVMKDDGNPYIDNGSSIGPSTITITCFYETGETEIDQLIWSHRIGRIGSYQYDHKKLQLELVHMQQALPEEANDPEYKKIMLEKKQIWDTMFKKQFETQIAGREEEYAKEILMKYLPAELKQKYFSQG